MDRNEPVYELAKKISAARLAYFMRVGMDYAAKKMVKEPSELDLVAAKLIMDSFLSGDMLGPAKQKESCVHWEVRS